MSARYTSAIAKKSGTLERFLPWLLVVGGTIGLICAFIITYEKLQLLQNPHYVPSCNLNPIISCGSVMVSNQSHLFGFPNPIIGLMAFPVLITTGVLLFSGVKLKKWYWMGLEIGSFLAVIFVHWLFYQSVYTIHSLCPYCMVVWIVTISTFWYTSLYNLRLRFNHLPDRMQTIAAFLQRHHLDILILWLLIIAGFILKHFWYYYGHNL
ncbi:MAG: vitamin K epoxide reductase family protein [Candidatus Saccharibacteria bacterium]